MHKIAAALFLLFPLIGFGQYVISGKVINGTDKKPVADASVFLSNATIGNKTAADGSFRLGHVKSGHYELVVSIVGYETFRQQVLVNGGDITFPNIELLPKTIELMEVKVKPDANWARNYDWFKQQFLGGSDNARQCKILNPQILHLSYDDSTKTLTAGSNDFLEIENKALGYKLKYLLTTFIGDKEAGTMYYEGSVLFENMDGTPSQHRRWDKNRLGAYLGSSMHFFRSVISNRVPEEGFKVYQLIKNSFSDRKADSLVNAKISHYKRLVYENSKWSDSLFYWAEKSQLSKVNQTIPDSALNIDEIIRLTDHKGIYSLDCENDGLYITYGVRKGRAYYPDDLQKIIITFKTPDAFFDSNGWIINPVSVVFSGFWSTKRAGDLLPVDYEPIQK